MLEYKTKGKSENKIERKKERYIFIINIYPSHS